MKKTAPLLATLLLASTVTVTSTAQEKPPAPTAPLTAERDPRAWREFASAAGRFAVTLPKLGEADPGAAFAEEAAAKFLDSFRLLDEGAQAGEVDRLIKALREKGEPVYGVKRAAAQDPDANADWINSKPQPAYPAVARAARAQGAVAVDIVVDEEGRVIAAQAKSGHPLLQAAAVKAAREARHKPTTVEGKRVKFAGLATYNFVLQ